MPEVEAMIDGLDQPNGVVFSPNGATLYVSDTGVLLHAGGAAGGLYAARGDGVRVHAPDGEPLGRIATATKTSNTAFGGEGLRRLFITSGPCIFAVDTKVEGFRHVGWTATGARIEARIWSSSSSTGR